MSHSSPNKLAYSLVSITGLVLMLVWMQGGFVSKVPPGTAQAAEKTEPVQGPAAKVEQKEIGETMRWPGTVAARTVVQVSPKVPARILEITVRAGDAVKAGQLLARLDPTELQSRANQARSGLEAAQAQAARADANLRRVQSLFAQEAATQQSLEAAQAEAKSAAAQVGQARAAIAAAESVVSETSLHAPFDGVIVKRNLEPGATALPGTAVLTLQSGQKLRVEAAVPESCARRLQPGAELRAVLGEKAYAAIVEEIAPAADPQTRTVLIKAGLANSGAAQPGAFVWLEQRCGGRGVLLVPAVAVSRSGQLESVRLLEQGVAKLRHVRTGKAQDGSVEVLSGLRAGDVVVLPR